MRNTMVLTGSLLLAMALIGNANAQQSDPGRKCSIDTTIEKDTGKPRNGVQVCSEGDGSGSVGFSVSGKELEHFLKYPFGQSDHSVPKDIGRGIEHLGREIGKIFR